jgi:hypothetical protein
MHIGYSTLEGLLARLTPAHRLFLTLLEELVPGTDGLDHFRKDVLLQAVLREGSEGEREVLYWKFKVGVILAPGGEPWPEQALALRLAARSALAAVRQFLKRQPNLGPLEEGAVVAHPRGLKLLLGRADCLTFDKQTGLFRLQKPPDPPSADGMLCEVCGKRVKGSLTVTEGRPLPGVGVVLIEETPDRDHIVCDGCNRVVCRKCCGRPEGGYCDDCVREFKIPAGTAAG